MSLVVQTRVALSYQTIMALPTTAKLQSVWSVTDSCNQIDTHFGVLLVIAYLVQRHDLQSIALANVFF